ncbi:TlpA family protein disulfide reductase [Noviherbaspirillum autotrophicum]|uniref:TlpA family protein disulfide reductase n=1 Tax=Noviherbaspirillum autotrophicum TaxID=709839 RepID=UPI0012FDB813|nr:TlpA disulfide reductase family protein [Noviherbaspirillum autotrophicum]
MSAGSDCFRRFILAVVLMAVAWTCPPLAAKENALRAWPKNLPSPSLKLTDLASTEWDLDRLRGKVVVLNFWTTWCSPCVDEIPFLNDLAAATSTTGKVVILGVNFKESGAAIQRFSQEHVFQYPILQDKSGETFRKWTTGILPTTILIAPDGQARWRIVGELERTDGSLRELIEKMLDERESNKAGPK